VQLRVTIITPASDVVEPSNRVEFAAALDYSGSAAVNFKWHSNEIDVADSALFATSYTTQWLVARSGALKVGWQYTFSLIAVDALGHAGQSNVTVRTNRPPAPGTFSASPRVGLALQTQFHLLAGGWSDPEDDFLNYRFGFLSSASGTLVALGTGTNTSAASTLPLGNLTTQIAVTDSLGAESCQYVMVTAELQPSADIIEIVDQTADAAELLLASGQDAMPLIASAAETLNAGLDDDAVAAASRDRLVSLALNASSATTVSSFTATAATLHATTLELLTAPPHRLSDTVQEQSVAFALQICNASRRLHSVPSEARISLITAASSVIDAGFLHTGSSGGSAISELLQEVHLLSMSSLAPGEVQLVTQAGSLSIGSQAVACSFGECPAVAVPIPLLNDDETINDHASFALSSGSVAEIMTTIDCEADDGVGLQVVRWGVNPYSSMNLGEEGTTFLSSAANASVSSLSVTACGREVAVADLSDPVRMDLPLAAISVVESSKPTLIEVICHPDESSIAVRCSSALTGRSYTHNITCPNDSTSDFFNASCPVEVSRVCVWWDGTTATWSTHGVAAIDDNQTFNTVQCASSHLTTFLGVLKGGVSSVALVIRDSPAGFEQLHKATVLLSLLGCIYGMALFVMARDLWKMKKMKDARATRLWHSVPFQTSLERMLDPAASAEFSAKEAQEQAAEISHRRDLAYARFGSTRSIRWSMSQWVGALLNNNVLLLLGRAEPSYEAAPSLLVNLITFLFAVALLFPFFGIEDQVYLKWSNAVEEERVVETIRASIVEVFWETVVLSIVVLVPRSMLSSSLRRREATRRLRALWEEKAISQGLLCIDIPICVSLVDLRRSQFLVEAASRCVERHLHMLGSTEHICQRPARPSDPEHAVVLRRSLELRRVRDDIVLKCRELEDQKLHTLVAASDSHCSSLGSYGTLMNGRVKRLGESSKKLPIGSSARPNDEWERVMIGALPDQVCVRLPVPPQSRSHRPCTHGRWLLQVLHSHVLELHVVNKLEAPWQRLAYRTFLAQVALPEAQRSPIKRRYLFGIILAYVLSATFYVLSFHIEQENQKSIDINHSIFAVAVLNTVVDLVFVTPLILFVSHVLLPALSERVLRQALEDAKIRAKSTDKGSNQDPHSRTRSSVHARGGFLAVVPAAIRAKNRWLDLLSNSNSSSRSELGSVTNETVSPGDMELVETAGTLNPIVSGDEANLQTEDAVVASRGANRSKTLIEEAPTIRTDDAVLPQGWHQALDETSGHPYFYNVCTGEISWEAPVVAVAAADGAWNSAQEGEGLGDFDFDDVFGGGDGNGGVHLMANPPILSTLSRRAA
jgi:hypothetical protein